MSAQTQRAQPVFSSHGSDVCLPLGGTRESVLIEIDERKHHLRALVGNLGERNPAVFVFIVRSQHLFEWWNVHLAAGIILRRVEATHVYGVTIQHRT